MNNIDKRQPVDFYETSNQQQSKMIVLCIIVVFLFILGSAVLCAGPVLLIYFSIYPDNDNNESYGFKMGLAGVCLDILIISLICLNEIFKKCKK